MGDRMFLIGIQFFTPSTIISSYAVGMTVMCWYMEQIEGIAGQRIPTGKKVFYTLFWWYAMYDLSK